jgi:cytoskeletal protein RodZ
MARSGRSVRRRKQQRDQRHQRVGVVVGICGAAVAALLCYQVFLRSDSTPTPATPSAAPAATVDATSTTSQPQEPTLPNSSFDELSVRDPFEPIAQYSTATTTPTTVPVTPTTTPDGISTTPTTSPAQNPAPVSDITLVDVYVDASGRTTAVVRVNGAEFSEVHEGDAFATNYRLVRFTSTSCADFTYADSPFSLCTGQQTQK